MLFLHCTPGITLCDDQWPISPTLGKLSRTNRLFRGSINIITSRMPPDKLATAKEKIQEFKTAMEPFRARALLTAEEAVIVERMQGPFNNVLYAARVTPDDATDCEQGIVQGFNLLAQWSEGKVPVKTNQVGDVTITQLSLAKESPFQPAVARVNDILLVSTSVDLLPAVWNSCKAHRPKQSLMIR